jgi:hypothetical protein
MNKFLRVLFIGFAIYFTWQISRIFFGDISFFQFFILSILVIIMLIISIFISGRAKVEIKENIENNLYHKDKERDFDS